MRAGILDQLRNGLSVRNGWLRMAALLALVIAFPAHAEVRLPNGEYRTSAIDLRVKVLGGYVTVKRSWQAVNINKGQYRWYMNPAWADLVIEYDTGAANGGIKSITRAGAKFEKKGDDLYVLVESDRSYFIRQMRDAQGAATDLTWSDREGNAIQYDTAGKIQSYSDRNGITVYFHRDTFGRIATIADNTNRTILTWAYASDGADSALTSITDYSGRKVQYNYDNAGVLKGVIDAGLNPWGYTYVNGLLHTQTDPENHTTTIDYAGNRAVTVTDPMSNATTYDYTYDRGTRQYTAVVKITDPQNPDNNRRTESSYDANGKLIQQVVGSMGGGRIVSQVIKDSANVDIAIDERHLRTRTEYDANRNPIKVTYPDGSSTSATYNSTYSLPLTRTDELGVTTKYEYDGHGNLMTLTEALGLPEQRVTTYTYDALGQRRTQTVKGATTAEDATTEWTYDEYGNVHMIADAEQNQTTFAYDVMGNENGRIDARGYPWFTETNAMGWVTSQKDPLDHETITAYYKDGSRKAVEDPEHHTTTYTYAANGQLETVTDPLGGITTMHYTKDGQRLDEIDANQVKTSYGYDTDGRLTTITDGASNVTTLVYDMTCDGSAAAGLDGLLTATKFPTYCEEYKYDQRGQRTQVTRVLPGANGAPAERQTSTTSYDAYGRKISESDPLVRTTQSGYDHLGRLKSVTDAMGGITVYTYDARDNLKTVTDANQHTHTFTYDKMNRVKAEARPFGEPIRYDYDETGELIARTNPKSEKLAYSYDDAGRKTTESQYAAGTQTASQSITYSYDGRNLLIGYIQTGDTKSSATYVYDAKGQRRDEAVTYGEGANAFTSTIHYGYEQNGLKKSLTYPDGTEQTSTYNNNRLASISIKGNAIAYEDYQWRSPTKITMPGVIKTLTYDSLQRPTEIKSQAIGAGSHDAPNGAIIMDYRYQYDLAGNITQRTTEDGDYLYTYDHIDRLTGATPPLSLQRTSGNPDGLPVEQYTYDLVHNRKTSAHQPGSWTYDENNELLSYGTGLEKQAYTYDANGNTNTQKTGDLESPIKGREFIYNVSEQLSEIKDNGIVVAKYQYDPTGRRIRKEINSSAVWYQYAAEGLIAEYSEGRLLAAYGWKPRGLEGGDPIWISDLSAGSWNIGFYHNDVLLSPQRVTAVDGRVTSSATTETFGKRSKSTGTNPLGFPGQYFDAESGLTYNLARYYDSSLGRYIETDPISLEGGINNFSYANQSPIRNVDPQGRFIVILIPAICAGGACEAVAVYVLAIAATCATVMMSEAASEAIDRTKEKSGERKAYSQRCIEQPPPNLSKCDEAAWKLQRNLDCLAMRIAFSQKWYGEADPAHQGEIDNLKIAIRKLEEFLKTSCCKNCAAP